MAALDNSCARCLHPLIPFTVTVGDQGTYSIRLFLLIRVYDAEPELRNSHPARILYLFFTAPGIEGAAMRILLSEFPSLWREPDSPQGRGSVLGNWTRAQEG